LASKESPVVFKLFDHRSTTLSVQTFQGRDSEIMKNWIGRATMKVVVHLIEITKKRSYFFEAVRLGLYS
jgi:hypothetical protein